MKLIRKSVSILLSLMMIFSLFAIVPSTAFAASEIEYISRSWNDADRQVVD